MQFEAPIDQFLEVLSDQKPYMAVVIPNPFVPYAKSSVGLNSLERAEAVLVDICREWQEVGEFKPPYVAFIFEARDFNASGPKRVRALPYQVPFESAGDWDETGEFLDPVPLKPREEWDSMWQFQRTRWQDFCHWLNWTVSGVTVRTAVLLAVGAGVAWALMRWWP